MALMHVLDAMYEDRLLVFGHRGASAYAPANTIPAFELAVEQGADGVELDVQLSNDGELVVIHDFTVDATTNGSGEVASMSLEELQSLDAGSYFSDAFSGTRIPTLAEVFDAVADKLYINVELKTLSREPNGLEQAAADLIQQRELQNRVIVSSFNPVALIELRRIAADIPIGYLYAPGIPDFPDELMNKLAYEAAHPYYEMLSADEVSKLKSDGLRVNTWTVNDVEQARKLESMGVDLIMTDFPDLIRDAVSG